MAVTGVRCGVVPLGDLRSGEFIFFSSYALSGLVLPFSYFCEMYVGVRPSMHLFRLFHVMRSFRKRASLIGDYYF
jgi:hypothetical protein